MELNLGVCVPSLGLWMDKFGQSMALAFAQYNAVKISWAERQRISLFTTTGSMLAFSRHQLVKNCLKKGMTHMIFADSDMSFPADAFHRLLEHGKSVVAVNAVTKSPPYNTTAQKLDGSGQIWSGNRKGLEEVHHVGCGLMLLDMEVVKTLHPPLFLQDWIPSMNAHCGEDVYFCMKLQEQGTRIYVDHDLSKEVRHWGFTGFGQEHYMGEERDVRSRSTTRKDRPASWPGGGQKPAIRSVRR